MLSEFHYRKYKEFIHTAINLGCVIAERKLHLVYGEGDQGLSKLVSEAVFIRGSQVVGIIPKALKPLRYLFGPSIKKELVVSSMQERISQILNYVETFVFLLGDLATAHLNIHKKSINLLNVNNFYINHAIKNHFILVSVKTLFICAPITN